MAELDFTTNATAGASTGGWNSGVITRFNRVSFIPTAADVLNIFDMQIGEKVILIAMKVVTGSNAATTVALGIGGATDSYLSATNVAVADEGTVTVGTTGAFLAGATWKAALTAADTVDALIAVTGTAKITLEFEMVSVRTTLA